MEQQSAPQFKPHPAQQKIVDSTARYKMVIAGRRFGKSRLCVNMAIANALGAPNQRIWYLGPTYRQVKDIAWKLLLNDLPESRIAKKNESELRVELRNGSEIALKGCDNPDSLVGVGLDFAILDEAAQMKSEVWHQAVRPMLVDHSSPAVFISTPKGYNWLYDLTMRAKTDPDFEYFHFLTTENVMIEDVKIEVEKARSEAISDYQKALFRQEFEASFETIVGMPRFDLDHLNRMAKLTVDPVRKDSLLNIYHPPLSETPYVMGVDTAEGIRIGDESQRDKSSVVIVNCTTFTVDAECAVNLPPDELAGFLKAWGNLYNKALIVVEMNNHGHAVLNELKKYYWNLYSQKVFDDLNKVWTSKLGWRTTSKTKPMMIAEIDKCLREGLRIPSRELISELSTYVVDDKGKTNASEGSYDDRVIALACALQGKLERFKIAHEPKPKPDPRYCVNRIVKYFEEEAVDAEQHWFQ